MAVPNTRKIYIKNLPLNQAVRFIFYSNILYDATLYSQCFPGIWWMWIWSVVDLLCQNPVNWVNFEGRCGINFVCSWYERYVFRIAMLLFSTFPVSIYRQVLLPVLRQKRYYHFANLQKEIKKWGAIIMQQRRVPWCFCLLEKCVRASTYFEVSCCTQNSLKTMFEEEVMITFLNNKYVSPEGNKTLWFLLWLRETYFIQ
jgi:hypothetical protein